MDIVFGGAYQGKLDFAFQKFSLREADVFDCAEMLSVEDADVPQVDMEKRCIHHLEAYVYQCVKTGTEPVTDFREDAVLICDDIFCGVVPMDALERKWREACGRYMTTLSLKADTVTRVFCGISMELKSCN